MSNDIIKFKKIFNVILNLLVQNTTGRNPFD